MPWRIERNKDGCAYAVVKESDGKRVGCHDTEDKAKAHLRALYANEPSKKALGGSASMNTFKIFAPTMIASRGGDGKLRIEGVASSTVRDHHGDQITRKALQKMAESARGLTIFLNHEYKVPEDVFGTVERVKLERTGRIDEATKEEIYDLRLGIVVQSKNPRAVNAFEQMESAEDRIPTKLGLSIGATVPEGGAKFDTTKGGRYIVDDLDLVETSLVSMPANPRSWVDYAVKHLAKNLAESNEGLPAIITKQRTALAELMEAEGVTVVNGVDEDDLVPDPETAQEAEDDAGEAHTQPDVNDSASDDQDTQDEDGTKVPVDDNNVDATQKTRVTVWDGDKAIEVDTGRSKPKDSSAQDDDAPENAGSPGKTKKSVEDDVDTAVVASIETSDRLLKSLQGQLKAARADNITLIEERDAAVEMVMKTLDSTQQLLTKLGETPAGRRTGFTEAQEELTAIRDDIYGADVKHLLLKKGTDT